MKTVYRDTSPAPPAKHPDYPEYNETPDRYKPADFDKFIQDSPRGSRSTDKQTYNENKLSTTRRDKYSQPSESYKKSNSYSNKSRRPYDEDNDEDDDDDDNDDDRRRTESRSQNNR